MVAQTNIIHTVTDVETTIPEVGNITRRRRHGFRDEVQQIKIQPITPTFSRNLSPVEAEQLLEVPLWNQLPHAAVLLVFDMISGTSSSRPHPASASAAGNSSSICRRRPVIINVVEQSLRRITLSVIVRLARASRILRQVDFPPRLILSRHPLPLSPDFRFITVAHRYSPALSNPLCLGV